MGQTIIKNLFSIVIKKLKSYQLQARGFTLVELLVGIAIVGLISTVAVANFRQGQRSAELRFAAEEIVAQIRQAQTMSTAGRTTKLCQSGDKNGLACISTSDCGTGLCVEQVPLGGYGLYFTIDSPTSFQLFADGTNYKLYDKGEIITGGEISMPPNVEISAVSGDTKLTVTFEPPKGKVFIQGMPSGTAQIILKHKVTQDKKTVSLNAVSGRIEIE